MNKLKDFMYDISDFLLGFIIIGLIAGLIFFKMGDTFTMNFNFGTEGGDNSKEISESNENIDTSENLLIAEEIPQEGSDLISISHSENQGENTETANNPESPAGEIQEIPAKAEEIPPVNETPSTSTVSEKTITVNIPSGSSAYGIGKILRSNSLIVNEKDFYNRSIELGLDSKLRSGSFKLSTSMSLDDMIKKLAGQ